MVRRTEAGLIHLGQYAPWLAAGLERLGLLGEKRAEVITTEQLVELCDRPEIGSPDLIAGFSCAPLRRWVWGSLAIPAVYVGGSVRLIGNSRGVER